MIEKLIRFLFPPKCILCHKLLKGAQKDICDDCLASLPEKPPTHSHKLTYIKSWSALWYYKGNVRQSILRFKFGNRQSYSVIYGQYMADMLRKEKIRFDVLTWVPISAMRKWKRGYDQVQLIGEAMSDALGVPLVPTLHKQRHTKPQSTLRTAAQRRANVLGAYVCVNQDQFVGKTVLLIDDIITTGATVSECARVLLTAGAAEIRCAAVASAINHYHRNR